MTLSEIWIYPIKSLGGIRLHNATVYGKGLQYDRRWMLVDQAGVAMTQREYPDMALFKPAVEGEKISITFRRGDKIIATNSFDIGTCQTGKEIKGTVWGDHVSVQEVDTQLSDWFTHHLKTPCRLVAFPEPNARPVDPNYSINSEHVSLADSYPFLVIGQGSLNDLNTRLAAPVPMNRFRPNFVFTGGAPFAEDHWRDLSIGGIRFIAVKKSARCALTTVNQDTAEKGAEPLRTLSAYRKVGNKVFFGQNLVALNEGILTVGDALIPG